MPRILTTRLRPLDAAIVLAVILAAAARAQTAPPPAPAPGAQERLWDASMEGDTIATAKALAVGAAIDSLDQRRSPNGRRALNWAAWFDRPEAIRFLVAHGATVNLANLTGFTPLHHAAENGSLAAAKALLELGADRNALNNEGETPADVARRRNHPEVAGEIE
jgi:ankyrin repeat protein